MNHPNESESPPAGSDMQTDYVVGQDNIKGQFGPIGFDIHNRVFVVSALASAIFIVLTLLFPEQAGSTFQSIVSFSTGTLDWYFIGLLFFGVLEPVYHANVSLPLGVESPFGADGELNPAAIADASALGLAGTYLHWGIHGWAVYVVMALALGIFTYNKGLPFSIRSAFFPILGERVWGWWGHVIDILAVFSTLFGLATSLGLGAQQANAGMNFVFGLEVSTLTQVIVIILVTAVALVSVWRGLEGGLKKLSEINMILAVLFFFFVLFAGPTLLALSGFWSGLTTYVTDFIPLSAPFGRDDDAYRQSWTIFYWAWWISWAPFVGMFIARVSRGRTVREFVLCVLLVPSLFIFVWMGVFGSTALEQLYADPAGSLVKEYVIDNYRPELSLFGMLNELPLTGLMSTLGIILALIFFGFRLPGHRYHHGRWQNRCSAATADVLGGHRGPHRDCAAYRWGSDRASGRGHRHRYSVLDCDVANVLLDHQGAQWRVAAYPKVIPAAKTFRQL